MLLLILASLGLLLYFHKINLARTSEHCVSGKVLQVQPAVGCCWRSLAWPTFPSCTPIDLSKLFSILNANILLVWTKKDIWGTGFRHFPALFHPAPSPTVFVFAFNCKWKHSPVRQRNPLVRFFNIMKCLKYFSKHSVFKTARNIFRKGDILLVP